MKALNIVLRILLSVFFAVSAISKIVSIEAFEVYLFRTSFLAYDAATLVARLLVAAELLIGLCLLIRLKFRFIWWATLFFLIIFSGFLAVQAWGGADDNCFCMGELVDFSPLESLIKNLVLLIMLVLIRNSPDIKFRGKNLVFAAIVIVSLAVPFVVSPPDLFVSGQFDEAEHDQKALTEVVEEGNIPEAFITDRKLLSFYSTGCRFCKMASTRIGAIVRKSDIDSTLVNVVFWGDSTVKAQEFYADTHSPVFDYTNLDTKPYLQITKGRMPLILLLEDGEVKHEMNYRTMDEKLIADFLKAED